MFSFLDAVLPRNDNGNDNGNENKNDSGEDKKANVEKPKIRVDQK